MPGDWMFTLIASGALFCAIYFLTFLLGTLSHCGKAGHHLIIALCLSTPLSFTILTLKDGEQKTIQVNFVPIEFKEEEFEIYLSDQSGRHEKRTVYGGNIALPAKKWTKLEISDKKFKKSSHSLGNKDLRITLSKN